MQNVSFNPNITIFRSELPEGVPVPFEGDPGGAMMIKRAVEKGGSLSAHLFLPFVSPGQAFLPCPVETASFSKCAEDLHLCGLTSGMIIPPGMTAAFAVRSDEAVVVMRGATSEAVVAARITWDMLIRAVTVGRSVEAKEDDILCQMTEQPFGSGPGRGIKALVMSIGAQKSYYVRGRGERPLFLKELILQRCIGYGIRPADIQFSSEEPGIIAVHNRPVPPEIIREILRGEARVERSVSGGSVTSLWDSWAERHPDDSLPSCKQGHRKRRRAAQAVA